MRSLLLAVVLVLGAMVSQCRADDPAQARTYWAYEGGWFAKSNDGNWYELNEQTFRKSGKPSLFKEIRRTPDFVELRDHGRQVEVRLMTERSMVHLIDKPGATWEPLYKGQWKTPAPLE